MSSVGRCPYCKNGIVNVSKKPVQGKNTKLYTCSNAFWTTQDSEIFELTQNATCSFRIWGNSLLKWGKRGIGVFKVKQLLQKKDVSVRLYSFNTKQEYFKYIILDKQYGISVLWDYRC